jgi:hypothetical protein
MLHMAQGLVDTTLNDGDATIVVDPDTDNAFLDGKCIAAAVPKLADAEKDVAHLETSHVDSSILSDEDISEEPTPAPTTSGTDDKGERLDGQPPPVEDSLKTKTLTIVRYTDPKVDFAYEFSGQKFIVPFDTCQTWKVSITEVVT